MTCHECGSDVAQNDVFCPFCGISLEPVALSDAEIDDSLQSTLMMQPEEAAALADASKLELSSKKTKKAEEQDPAETSSSPVERIPEDPAFMDQGLAAEQAPDDLS